MGLSTKIRIKKTFATYYFFSFTGFLMISKGLTGHRHVLIFKNPKNKKKEGIICARFVRTNGLKWWKNYMRRCTMSSRIFRKNTRYRHSLLTPRIVAMFECATAQYDDQLWQKKEKLSTPLSECASLQSKFLNTTNLQINLRRTA